MVGSTIACGLAHSGLRIALLDRATPKPFVEGEVPHIRVSAINLASEQVLRNIGAWHNIERMRLCPYRALSAYEMPAKTGFASKLPDISSWARTEFTAEDLGRTHLGHIIENDVIQLALLERVEQCSSVDLICPADIDSISPCKDGARVIELSSGEKLHSPLIVGADGAASRVRELSGIGQYKDAYTQKALVATVRYDGSQEDATWQCFRPEGPLAFLPLASSGGNAYASLVWYDDSDKIDALGDLTMQQLQQEVVRHYPSMLPRITQIHQAASFPLNKSHALRYWTDGVVLAGDAAHTINPLAGQGVNLGIIDAAVLIDLIAKAVIDGKSIADPGLLNAYQSSRRKHNQFMMSAMDFFYYGFGSKALPLRIARNLGLGLAQRSGIAKKQVTQFATGLKGDLPRIAKAT